MQATQQEIIDSLPPHLRPFVRRQDYQRYTPRDHAAWRFIMRHLTRQLQASAHPVYLEGLARTGIALDHIPSIDEMNQCLARLGWRAVVVDGFIPPAIFMEFQALRVLVIAVDMRSVDHILYTPAPDIVHEAAGHAPFIVDVDYAEFLQRFGEIGMKAIASRHDFDTYEAVRRLSILKECPDSSAAEIEAAERSLRALNAADTEPSEASLLARLHWWTVEYGLVGDPDDYRIFGAGLLSSLGESRDCLDDLQVTKLPLTVDAVASAYDITRQQRQLFVTRSCKHLGQVLEEFAAAMCFRRGGADSLRKAIAAGSVCSARYDSGMQVSGVISELQCDAVGNATWFRTDGPTQLAYCDRELYGHGVATHPQGIGAPIGHLKDFSRCLSSYTIDELRAHDIVLDNRVRLDYLSGIIVEGILREIVRQDQRNLVLAFDDCRVTGLGGRSLVEPAAGRYYMAVGSRIDSVYGGVADRERLQLYKPTPATRTIQLRPDADLISLYRLVDELRRGGGAADESERQTLRQGLARYPEEWLLRVECLQLPGLAQDERLCGELAELGRQRPELREVLSLELAGSAQAA